MFSKEFAKKASAIIAEDTHDELVEMFSELLAQEEKKLSSLMAEPELRATVARIEQLKKLKNYKQYILDAIAHGS